MKLDRQSDIPIGVQLGWELRARIGELQAGERLPGVRELASEAGVNVNTARAAYAKLEAEGLIRVEHGRGTFVAEQRSDDRVAAVAQSARRAAADAGIDPRELAAALYADPAPVGDSAQRRRALRADIAQLEAELAAEVAARTVADKGPGELPSGGRLLGEDDLRAQRDDLMVRLRELRDGPAPEAPARTSSATRPGLAWRAVYGR